MNLVPATKLLHTSIKSITNKSASTTSTKLIHANKVNNNVCYHNNHNRWCNKKTFTTKSKSKPKNEDISISTSTNNIESIKEWKKNMLSLLEESNNSNKNKIAINKISEKLSNNSRNEFNQIFSTTLKQSNQASASASATSKIIVKRPSNYNLKLLILNQTIPFIGFGLMDNSILILAGDAIDTNVGVALGISTLCSAALGNIISNNIGVVLGGFLEELCRKIGLPTPCLSTEQRTLRIVRVCNNLGICIGLTIGCIIGMFPLLFIDHEKDQKKKEVNDKCRCTI